MIEVRYAGVVVGRSSIIRELDTRGLFLGMTEPLPLGTVVELKVDELTVPGRVELVSESQELARAGMRVRFSRPDSARLFGTPVEAPPEVAPPVWFSAPVSASERPSTGTNAGSAPQASASSMQNGPRRIVVDASSEKAPQGSPSAEGVRSPRDASDAGRTAPAGDVQKATVGDTEGAADNPVADAPSGRVPASDPSALGAGVSAGGGRKNRRNRRR